MIPVTFKPSSNMLLKFKSGIVYPMSTSFEVPADSISENEIFAEEEEILSSVRIVVEGLCNESAMCLNIQTLFKVRNCTRKL